jgi:arginase
MSEDTARDMRGVECLSAELTRRLRIAPNRLVGRQLRPERPPWRDDLRASRGLLEQAADIVRSAVRRGAIPITLAPDCALAIGTLPAVAAGSDGVTVLWLDAHCDYDVPETTTHEFLGCMSLAGTCGAWDTGFGAISPLNVVHVGARARPGDFDHPAQEHAGRELRAMLPADATPQAVCAMLGDGPVYIHFDPDVLDPSVNPIPYGRAHGMDWSELAAVLRAVRSCHHIVGLELTAFHSSDDASVRDRVCGRLAEMVELACGRVALDPADDR